MTEQELLKKIGTLTTPEHLLECAKAYADARESKEIAELRDQLRIETDLKKVYSKACVESGKVIEARDTEIAELKAQVEGLKTDMQHSRLIEAAQVKESNELKAEIKRLREGIQKAIDNFFPAIGSHKECIQDLKALLSPELLTNGDCPNCYDGCEWCKSVTAECSMLSPADAVGDVSPLNEDQHE